MIIRRRNIYKDSSLVFFMSRVLMYLLRPWNIYLNSKQAFVFYNNFILFCFLGYKINPQIVSFLCKLRRFRRKFLVSLTKGELKKIVKRPQLLIYSLKSQLPVFFYVFRLYCNLYKHVVGISKPRVLRNLPSTLNNLTLFKIPRIFLRYMDLAQRKKIFTRIKRRYIYRPQRIFFTKFLLKKVKVSLFMQRLGSRKTQVFSHLTKSRFRLKRNKLEALRPPKPLRFLSKPERYKAIGLLRSGQKRPWLWKLRKKLYNKLRLWRDFSTRSKRYLFYFYVRKTHTNTFVTVTNGFGNVRITKSSGESKTHRKGKKQKKSLDALRELLSIVTIKMTKLGISSVYMLYLKMVKQKFFIRTIMFNLSGVGVYIRQVKLLLVRAHNGVRQPKLRRKG